MWRIVATPKSQGLGSVSALTEQLVYSSLYRNIRSKRLENVATSNEFAKEKDNYQATLRQPNKLWKDNMLQNILKLFCKTFIV